MFEITQTSPPPLNAQVSSKCQSGFKAAVDLNCYDACANGGYLQPFVTDSRLNEACNGALSETPRPLCHDACVRGYRSGVKDMAALLVKRMTEVTSQSMMCFFVILIVPHLLPRSTCQPRRRPDI